MYRDLKEFSPLPWNLDLSIFVENPQLPESLSCTEKGNRNFVEMGECDIQEVAPLRSYREDMLLKFILYWHPGGVSHGLLIVSNWAQADVKIGLFLGDLGFRKTSCQSFWTFFEMHSNLGSCLPTFLPNLFVVLSQTSIVVWYFFCSFPFFFSHRHFPSKIPIRPYLISFWSCFLEI